MADTIRARVRRGMLELLEKLNLPEGTEVTVTIHDKSTNTVTFFSSSTDTESVDRDAFRRSAGGWKDTVDAEALIDNIYASRLLATRPVPKL